MTKRKLNRLLEGIVIGLTVPTFAFGAVMTASEYSAARIARPPSTRRRRRDAMACPAMPKDVCIAEAKAAEKKAKADAEAQYKNTDKARQDAAIAAAKADYDVAKEKCDDKTGNDKDVCIKEAKAAETKAIADAKATQKIAAVRQDAKEDKMDADYKVAIEKCDALSGAAKDSCVSAAKTRYHK